MDVVTGGASGYQYSLQNAEVGLVILVMSRYAKLKASGTLLLNFKDVLLVVSLWAY